ncbi:hypothetical protein AVEN_222277-1 [Araneus ventricosus]|uniref:Uncharacterized protein n=1 Tax=Araneus ventricosus TaxID=182803 RepID=A0A4Y2RU23_ARAVE|nr:hypothetical protein AVEN_222277-1 [Araneus ventricosus]
MIKTKNLKIIELQEEIKALKEAQPESSDMSSLESLSAGDIMINLPSANDSFDSTSFASESDGGDDDDSFQIAGFLSNPFSAFDEDFMHDFSIEDDSIEYPRASSPAPQRNSVVVNPLDSNFDDEPQVRRPTKRRLPVRTLDSSEEDNDRDLEPPPAPSPKRTSWRQLLGEAGQSSSQGATDVQETAAQGSVENGHLPIFIYCRLFSRWSSSIKF